MRFTKLGASMYEVYTGKDGQEVEEYLNYRTCLFYLVRLRQWIPLSGGSDDRRSVREFYRQIAKDYNLWYKGSGCMVEIGGMEWDIPEDCRNPKRGEKTVRYWVRDDDYEIQKVDWRKAKKLSRKYEAMVLPKMVLECCNGG